MSSHGGVTGTTQVKTKIQAKESEGLLGLKSVKRYDDEIEMSALPQRVHEPTGGKEIKEILKEHNECSVQVEMFPFSPLTETEVDSLYRRAFLEHGHNIYDSSSSKRYGNRNMLSIQDLCVDYSSRGITSADSSRGRNYAIDGMYLNIMKGEKVAVMGINGGGKSTLFKTLALGSTCPLSHRFVHSLIHFLPRRRKYTHPWSCLYRRM